MAIVWQVFFFFTTSLLLRLITCLIYEGKRGYGQSKGNTFHKHAISPAEKNRK